MGQYYVAIILGPSGEPREFIRAWVCSWDYTNGSKLMEHSYIGNKYVSAVEWLLSPRGPFWKSRLVWAGDYATEEPDADQKNLYHEVLGDDSPEAGKRQRLEPGDVSEFRYVVNHTKQVYVDKQAAGTDEHGYRIHPLPLLTAEGNGRGGGDYRGANEMTVGSWARDVISVEREAPADYELMNPEFRE